MTADSPDTEVSIEAWRERIRSLPIEDALTRSVEAVGRAVQKLLPGSRPIPYGVSIAILATILVLLYLVEILLQGRPWSEHKMLNLFSLVLVGLLVLALWIHRTLYVARVPNVRHHLLEHVEDRADLASLEQGLRFRRDSFGLVVVLAILLGLLTEWWSLEFVYQQGDAGAYPSLSRLLVAVGFSLCIASILDSWAFLKRLGGFRLQLYSSDPSKAEVIVRMSGVLRKALLLIAIFGVCLVLLYNLFNMANPFILTTIVILLWIPLIGLFAIGQGSLSKIIVRAKWRELREVQERVDRLKREGDIEHEGTMETIRRLTDYHDRIFRTPNTALNLRAGLNFVNSLLLPVIALLLANLDRLLELIR